MSSKAKQLAADGVFESPHLHTSEDPASSSNLVTSVPLALIRWFRMLSCSCLKKVDPVGPCGHLSQADRVMVR